ncbi:MAG: PEP-utilizing enzyme [Candidatus Paceibacterota bacterium]
MKTKKKTKKILFGTKAETLEELNGVLQHAVVDDLLRFTAKEWKEGSKKILEKIEQRFGAGSVIIRSSALAEDRNETSNAGRFKSEGNVSTSPDVLTRAIDGVILSYGDFEGDNQVFVQNFISNVDMSGVIFTRDLNTFAPYITINYDDVSGLTDTITSGTSQVNKTLVVFRGKEISFVDERIGKLLKMVGELEELFNTDAIDIEFLYKDGIIHLLQVRPLAIKNDRVPETAKIADVLESVFSRITELSQPHPDLYGKENIYGIMPDWNPAEMIGIKPRALALSLYKELITDSVWAFQRDNYGYKRLRSFPLLVSLAGHPYIDVRVDFNSFIPKVLNDNLSDKLVNFYLHKLKSIPTSHDKVEFDIVYSCYSLDIDERLKELLQYDFSEQEIKNIKNALLELTNNIIKEDGLYRADIKKIQQLEIRLKELLSSNLKPINKIYWLVEDCKRYGTLPFAGIARAAFIAVQFLDSMVNLNIISIEEKNFFLNSLNTVTKQLSDDIERFYKKEMSLEEFLDEYGHLRPGTYDILSESYKENINKYFDLNSKTVNAKIENMRPFSFSSGQIGKINELLKSHNILVSAEHFVTFMREAIEGRERAKFLFTKNVSEILRLVREYGKSFGFSVDDMSYAEITTMMKSYSIIALPDEKKMLNDEIVRNKEMHELCKYINFPYLISAPDDIFSFHMNEVEPNFITTGSAVAEVVIIHPAIEKSDIKGKIVFIENADPGFDWIFSHGIKGLITTYGGANSHMAIRSAELSIPAVIGCGPALFEKWSKAHRLEVNCLNKKVFILS